MRNQNAKIALLTSLMMSSLVGYAQQNETVIKNGNGDKEVKVIVKTDKPQKMRIEKRVTVTDKGETIIKVDTIMEDVAVVQGGGMEKRIIIKGKGDKVEGIEEGNPNKEMKIVIKGDKKDGKDDKEIVIYKKYVVKDSADMDATMKEIQIEEEAAGTPSGARRKEIIVIDGESIEKGVEGIGEEIEGIVEGIGEEIEKNVQVFVDENGNQQIIRIETENENDGDTTEVKLKGRKVIIIKDNDGTHVSVKKKGSEEHGEGHGEGHGGDDECCEKRKAVDVEPFALDLGLNNYMTDGKLAKISDPRLQLNAWRSVDVNCYFAPTRVALTNNGKVNLKTAISLDMNNLMFNNDSSYLTKNPTDYLSFTKVEQPLQKNKLLATYVQLPLLLNFQTNPGKESKNVSFSIGGYAGYLLGSRAKHITADGDKVHDSGDYNLNPIKYGLTARLDFRWFDFYVNYNLSPLFEDKKGPTTQLVSAGLNLLNF
jgi:hypothetical protein